MGRARRDMRKLRIIVEFVMPANRTQLERQVCERLVIALKKELGDLYGEDMIAEIRNVEANSSFIGKI